MIFYEHKMTSNQYLRHHNKNKFIIYSKRKCYFIFNNELNIRNRNSRRIAEVFSFRLDSKLSQYSISMIRNLVKVDGHYIQYCELK